MEKHNLSSTGRWRSWEFVFALILTHYNDNFLDKWQQLQIPNRQKSQNFKSSSYNRRPYRRALRRAGIHWQKLGPGWKSRSNPEHPWIPDEENTDSECTQPLCCRKVSNGVKNSEKSHYWGTRRSCDIPFRTFEATMEAAKRKLPNPDLIFWTGDAPAHDIWAYSKGSFWNWCYILIG